MLYFFIFLLLFILSYRYDYAGRKNHFFVWFFVAYIILVSLAGLRYRIGVDSIRYESFYKMITGFDRFKWSDLSTTRFEPLFYLFATACKTVTSDFTFLQFAHAAILNGVIFWFFYKNTKHVFTGIFMYYLILYFPLNTEVLRESLAICCFLLAWPSFVKGRWWLYILLILIGSGFHTGAYLMLILPILWLPGIRQIFTFGRRTIICCAALLLIGFSISAIFFNLIQVLSMTDNVSSLAERYGSNEIMDGNIQSLASAILLLVKFVGYPAFALWLLSRDYKMSSRKLNREISREDNEEEIEELECERQELEQEHKINKKIEFMAMMGIYVTVLNIFIAILYRFNNYFFIFGILAISKVMYEPIWTKSGKKLKLSFAKWFLIIIPMLLISLNGLIVGKANKSGTLRQYMRIYPYSWRLDPQDDDDREALYRYYKAW